jgi:DNA-binding transcriptional LysR family regulator
VNLNQLKIFYTAAKKGSLSAAAEELFITQPAVTKGVQRLQEFYEIKFVDHIGKKLVLTDAGEVLFGIAEKIFELETSGFFPVKVSGTTTCRKLLSPLAKHTRWCEFQ